MFKHKKIFDFDPFLHHFKQKPIPLFSCLLPCFSEPISTKVLLLALEKCYLLQTWCLRLLHNGPHSFFKKNDKWSHRPLRSMHGGTLHQQSKTVSDGPVELKGLVNCFKKITVQRWTLYISLFYQLPSLLLQRNTYFHQWSRLLWSCVPLKFSCDF